MSQTIPAQHFAVLTPRAFLDDVCYHAEKAQHRFYAQAMEVEPGETTNRLLSVLKTTAQNGIDTRLHVDHYAFLITDGMFNYLALRGKKGERNKMRLSKKHETLEDLKQHGVKIVLTNKPSLMSKLVPTKGRNHMKIVIIDDAAWIGGVNFHDSNFASADFMVKIQDSKMVKELETLYLMVDLEKTFSDYIVRFDDVNLLLVDSNIPEVSIILDYAVRLAANAKQSIRLISPMIPDGRFLATLSKAHKRGILVDVITHTISTMSGFYKMVNSLNNTLMHLKHQTIPTYFYPHRLHAKVLIVDEKVAIFGSHNFSGKGVTMGTAELALQTSDTYLVQNLLSFFRNVRNGKK